MRNDDKAKPQFQNLPPHLRQAVEVASGIIRRMTARGLDIPEKDGLISRSASTNEENGNGDK